MYTQAMPSRYRNAYPQSQTPSKNHVRPGITSSPTSPILSSPESSPNISRQTSWTHIHDFTHQRRRSRKDSASDDPSKEYHAMDAATVKDRRATNASVSSGLSSSSSYVDLTANPFELRYGRRYLRDLAYPLPVDLSEIHRQSLRTLLGVTIFSKPACGMDLSKSVPKKVLEVGCGSAYWTSSCHEWLASQGHPDVSFTGTDIAPLATDLAKQGVNWKFVQHDFRRLPWPFEDGEFDFVMLKDLSLTMPMGVATQRFMDETMRILAPKGTLEIWESDHVLRCLLPQPPPPRGMTTEEEQTALQTKTYLTSTATPFAPAQNKYVVDSNLWIHAALLKLNLPSSPCARIAQILFQETDTLKDVKSRRIAVPMAELRWEKDPDGNLVRRNSSGNLLTTPPPKGKAKVADSILTEDQAALRYTASLTIVQKIESLEPLLKEASGKNAEEWTRWWSNMMTSLLDQDNGGSSGEVLEVGAWWATRCD